MTDVNKHIEDYLLYYLKFEFNPEFAVLLQGEWGCGKTWFIEKFIEKYSEPEGFKFLYITLYGVTKYSEIRIPDFISKKENCILVFDDLERCDISIKNIMGYINNFVEHQKLRVILLSNEEQLQIKEEKENDNWLFHSIKEKLIGKTFKIKYDFDSAFKDFISQIQNAEISEFIKSEKQAVFDIFNIARFNNLRHLKQSLWDY